MEDRDELLAHYEAMRADLLAAIARVYGAWTRGGTRRRPVECAPTR